MSGNPNINHGGGGLIIGSQPLDYWLTNFAFMLPPEMRNRCNALVAQYQSVPLGEDDTLFLLDCMKLIVKCWNGFQPA
jgi:hypothetical protein